MEKAAGTITCPFYMMHEKLQERFWNKVNKTDYCWVWTAGLDNGGYGRLGFNHYPLKAHRISWEIEYGPIPDGLGVLHKCDNRKCVRPDHLFLGTPRDNILDMDSKGRRKLPKYKLGEKNPVSKLSESDVLEIRDLYPKSGLSMYEIADRFFISAGAVKHIIHRRTWKHI